MQAFEKELKDYLKTALIALLPGIVFAMILSAVMSLLTSFAFVQYFILGVLLLWAIKFIPKEMDTFWEVLVITFFLAGLAGIITFIFPMASSYLGWVTLTSYTVWINMIVTAALTLSVLNKYTNWL